MGCQTVEGEEGGRRRMERLKLKTTSLKFVSR
jgi:hypothetical protein